MLGYSRTCGFLVVGLNSISATLHEYLEKKSRLQTPSEVSKLLASVPKVIPDRHELHPDPEDIVNDMSIEKDSPKSNLECYSPVTNHGWQDYKESGTSNG